MKSGSDSFEMLADSWCSPPPDAAEAALKHFEQLWQVKVTFNDVGWILHGKNEPLLSAERLAHNHPECRTGRPANREYERRCIEQCFLKVKAMARRHQSAFMHKCWRGQSEVVVPIYRNALLYLTMFIHYPPKSRRVKNPDQDMIDDAHMLGTRIIDIAEHAAEKGEPDPQKRLITRLVSMQRSERISLQTVAAALGVSCSRASHLITELYGKSWRELQLQARFGYACRLLRQGMRVNHVAELCGYDDPNTFSRIFRKRFEVSPTRWRKMQPAAGEVLSKVE